MIGEVVVVVPAADEQTLIGGCLQSLAVACDEVRRVTGDRVRASVVVVLDDCRDRSAQIVAGFVGVTAIEVDEHCVGRVRGLGAEFALGRAGLLDELWLANTDADSEVPRNWLTHMLDEAARGADLVVGTVQPGPELPPIALQAWLAVHDQRDGHRHVHGANLGIRAGTLADLGGWSPLAVQEDVDLVTRAVSAGFTVVRSGAIPVRSSARSHGRVPDGFSRYVREIVATHAPAQDKDDSLTV